MINNKSVCLAFALALTACGGSNNSTSITINSFTAASGTTDRGVPITFNWNVAGANGAVLTCELDTDGDGVNDYVINDCSNNTSQAHTFPVAGSFTAQLTVSDGSDSAQQTFAITASSVNLWTWISGSNLLDQPGVYGVKGIADAANVPGARSYMAGARDSNGNFWVFGGYGVDSTSTQGKLNDLWRWDGSNWTWMSGSNVIGQAGTYGVKGTADAANTPSARIIGTQWIDGSGNFWIFGGNDGTGLINDLWRWDGSSWTWVSGSNTSGQAGVYGTIGVANASNVPGARAHSINWTDSEGNLWLFGGSGFDSTGASGNLNDLWRWDGTNWTWMAGSKFVNQSGVYGVKGTADAANVPGARSMAASWVDENDNLWIFGGRGRDSAGSNGAMNDLWRWDGTHWTWISGSDTVNQIGSYGTRGTADAANVPGARGEYPLGWVDSAGNFWLFGGLGYDKDGNQDDLNDLWRWDGTNWTWMSGGNTVAQTGNYGTQGTVDAANMVGAREASKGWVDNNGDLWLFGGLALGSFNDLWRYQP